MDRRTFLRLAATSALAIDLLPRWSTAAGSRSRIVAISDPAIRHTHSLDTPRIKLMLDRALTLFTGADDAREAWRSLFAPGDVVGIKVNCLAGRGLSTSPPLVEAIALSLQSIGITADRIIAWDRNRRDLASAGFTAEARRRPFRVTGTDEVGFDGTLYEHNSIGSMASSILTQLCTAVINVPVLKDHGITGVSMSMKNYYGAIHNPNKYHPDGGDPYIADLNEMPFIRGKERLIVCDCLRAQYNGGPAFDPRWNWYEGTLMVGRDPVALDTTGHSEIERKRREAGLPSLRENKRFPSYITTAGTVNRIGTADPAEIDVLRDEI